SRGSPRGTRRRSCTARSRCVSGTARCGGREGRCGGGTASPRRTASRRIINSGRASSSAPNSVAISWWSVKGATGGRDGGRGRGGGGGGAVLAAPGRVLGGSDGPARHAAGAAGRRVPAGAAHLRRRPTVQRRDGEIPLEARRR